MDCRGARLRMHETLDGREPVPADLTEHLRACTECANHYSRLRAAQGAVCSAVWAPVPGERLHEAVERARAGAEALGSAAPTPRLHPARLGVALTCGLAVFALGAWCGRTAWPREVATVRTEVRPEIVERVVEKRVEVPVPVVEVRERVVVRMVRVAAPVRAARGSRGPEVPPARTFGAAGPRSAPAFHIPPLATPVVSQEVLPATIAGPTRPPGEPGDAGLPDPDSPQGFALAWSWRTHYASAHGQEAPR